MPPALSKEEDEAATRKRRVNALLGSVFQSVVQHVITLQSEPMLVREVCKGDLARSASQLANSAGLVGVLGLFLNQVGGKATDAIGRKLGLLLGPIGNVILGLVVFSRPNSEFTVLACRVLRMVITTFSNTVVVSASMMDILSGKDLGVAMTQMGAMIGAGIISGPILESIVLQRFKHPRYSYLTMSVLAGVQVMYNLFVTEETLAVAKRATLSAAFTLQNFNPFGFMKLYTCGSKPLQDIVTATSLQMAVEGKNISDLGQIWQRNHLKWDTPEIRNFVVVYGTLCVAAGGKLTPYLLKNFSLEAYTNITQGTNAFAYLTRVLENQYTYILGTLFLLPGVNGSAANALKSLASDLATAEGFGKGEFSAYTNNIRALVGTLATLVYGNWYAMCVRKGIPCGTTWWTTLVLGVLIPQYIIWKTQCGTKGQEMLRK